MPTPREQLSEAMRKARLEAGFDTHAKLARKMNTSRPAISRAESANQPVPSDALLAAWARACGVPVEEFTEIVARAKSDTPEWFGPYLSAEQAATRLWFWEPMVFPGVFQTAAYARALLSDRPRLPEQLQALVAQRLERQQVIGRAAITAVIDHRVLAIAIGSPVIMAEQCAFAASLIEGQKISLHVVPEGANIALTGAVAIATKGAVSTVSMSASTRDITSTAADVVDENMTLFGAILGTALGPAQSLECMRTWEERWKERS